MSYMGVKYGNTFPRWDLKGGIWELKNVLLFLCVFTHMGHYGHLQYCRSLSLNHSSVRGVHVISMMKRAKC